jgi:hypothetical protein
VSARRACGLARMQRSTWCYRSQARDHSALRMRIRDIAQARPRFGYVRILVMLKCEGWNVGKTRIYRLYRLENLQLRMRSRRRKRRSLHRGVTPSPTGHHQYGAMDVVHDQLANGRVRSTRSEDHHRGGPTLVLKCSKFRATSRLFVLSLFLSRPLHRQPTVGAGFFQCE